MKLPSFKMPRWGVSTVRWDVLKSLSARGGATAPAPRPTVSRKAFAQPVASAPTRLRLRDMALIWACAAFFAASGIGLVHLRMSTRDDQIETRRLQDQLLVQRDLAKELEAGLGTLQRREVLREVAVATLGMVEPAPESVGELAIDDEAWKSWRVAEARARERLNSAEKEVR